MLRPALSVLIAAATLTVVTTTTLYGQELEPTSEPDDFLLPRIDVEAHMFESTLPSTTWKFETDLLVFHTDYGGVDFSDGNDGDEAAAGSRFSLGWEGDSGYGIRTRFAQTGIEGPLRSSVSDARKFPAPHCQSTMHSNCRPQVGTSTSTSDSTTGGPTWRLESDLKRLPRRAS